MKILVIGGGGREHAIAWRLAQCASVEKLFASPGNPGIARVAECVRPEDNSVQSYLNVARSVAADLTVVGPEAPLVSGIVDLFRHHGLAIVGPTAEAARLEGSKIYAKQFMERAGIPTARFLAVDSLEAGLDALNRFDYPLVLKADGLAAGKGVVIAATPEDAKSALAGLTSGQLVGKAGNRLVIEEFLTGEEVSFIVLSDGTRVLPLLPTQDHKAVFDGDTGPNTGGMGAYCDARILPAAETQRVLETIVRPTVERMSAEGAPFTGFLYCGLMMTASGPKVLEYNVRLGDPETQSLMPCLDGDFAEVLLACANADLSGVELTWSADPAVCVVMASAGYPASARTGDRIRGIEEAESVGATVFHAGTRACSEGLETAGGRVLGVTARGRSLGAAIGKAYEAVGRIAFDGMHYRRDIGRKGLKRWPQEP